MNKESKIFIAGHTGMLGNAINKKLREKGFNNLLTVERKILDLQNKTEVDSFLNSEKPDIIFNAAGKTGGIVANKNYPVDFLQDNLEIQSNLFSLSLKHAVTYFVFYASSCVYPKLSPQPIKEEYLWQGTIEETSDAYAAAKIAGLVGCKAYNSQYNKTKFICLLPNSMYGPYDNFDLNNSHVLSALIRKFHDAKLEQKKEIQLWGSGSPMREFIFSEDVADASIFAVENAYKLENKHYNVGSSNDISIKDLANIIARIVGFEGNIEWDISKPDGTPRKLLDSKQFLNIGWKPSTSLEKGLEKTYEWFISNT